MPDQSLTIFRNGGVPTVSKVWQGVQLPTARLDEGVGAGFARVTYKGKQWGYKYQGQNFAIEYPMPDGSKIPSPYLDVVILRASKHPSKAWYAGAYEEGKMGPPDCWSTNGEVPDSIAPNRQAKKCGSCPHNGWGSKVNRETGQATRGKACMDMKRLAVVPIGDIENKGMGGPVMLSVPPSSLKRLGPYQYMLESKGVNYAQVWTRVAFLSGPNAPAYPVFDFDAKAVLNDAQAQQVVDMLEHPLIDRILDAELEQVEAWDESAESVHRQIKPDTAAAVAAAVAQPVTQSASVPHGSTHDDGLDIPAHLKRAKEPATASPAQPASQPQPEPETAPEPAAAPAMALPEEAPPGVDAEQWKQFLAMQRGQAPKRRGRPPAAEGKRTPPVSPQPTDSAAVVAAQATIALPDAHATIALPDAHATIALPDGASGTVTGTPAGAAPVLDTLMATIAKTI